MNAKNAGFIKGGMLATVTVAMLALAPHVVATPVQIGFNGGGGIGHVSLTVGPDALAGATPGDPAKAQLITNASGTFSDTNVPSMGIASITGVLARNFAIPEDVADGAWQPGDLPFPASFSSFAVVASPPAVTFDDLFYPGGSPSTCWDYPFFGGFLDDYGVMLKLDNGGYVDLWSNGVMPGGLSYGFAVIMPISDTEFGVSDYQSSVRAAVPEPDLLWLFGAATLGLFAWRRNAEKRA
jgi:hypothetical protein